MIRGHEAARTPALRDASASTRRRRTVALVMPVRNEEQVVARTLDAVFASTRLPDEIIVADGASTDGTVERIRTYQSRGTPLRIVDNRKIYSGGGRNAAIRATTCDVILLADFGNAVAPTWVEEMIRPFEEHPSVDVVTGIARPLSTSDFEHCMAAIHYHDVYRFDALLARGGPAARDAIVPSAIIPGANCLAITRETWERVGGFPEWLHRAQDKLFSRKAHCVGARACVAWNATVAHHVRGTPREVFRQLFSYSRGDGRTRYLNRHFLKLAAFYAVVLGLACVSTSVPAAAALGLVLLVAYYYRAGLRKVVRIDGGLKKLEYLWLTAAVLFSRDAGTIAGHFVGWYEWFFVPPFRTLFWEYMRGCDRRPLRMLSD